MNKRKKRSKIGLMFIVALIVYFSVTIVGQQKTLFDVNDKISDIQAKIAQEKKTANELEEQKKNVESDENIEKVARERLGWVKQGERVFVDINR